MIFAGGGHKPAAQRKGEQVYLLALALRVGSPKMLAIPAQVD